MALSGIHVVCASARLIRGSSLLGRQFWSETLSLPGTPTNVVTINVVPSDETILQISAGVDVYVAVGPNPDATQPVSNSSNNARIFIAAGVTMPIFCTPGDKVAFTPA